MLAVIFVNDSTGDMDNGNYNYRVMVNKDVIAVGRVEGHNRNTGWQGLIKKLAKQIPTKREDDIRLMNGLVSC